MSISLDARFQHALNDWSTVVRPLISQAIEDHLFYFDDTGRRPFDYVALETQLQQLSLQEIAALPIRTFGAIGEDASMLKPEAFLWLLPVILRFAARSEEESYAWGVISRLLQELVPTSIWQRIKRKVSKETLDCVHDYAKQCCSLGWAGTNERRLQKRLQACEKAFG